MVRPSRIAWMEEYAVLLLVSAGLRARLEAAGITGVAFVAPEQYGD